MLQRKLSKHFIYNWLKSDLFGEFTLQKRPRNKLAKKILNKIWIRALSWKFKKFATSTSSLVKYNFFLLQQLKFQKFIFKKNIFKNKLLFSLKVLNNIGVKKNSILYASRAVFFYKRVWYKAISYLRYIQKTKINRTKFRFKYNKKYLYLNFNDKPYTPRKFLVKRTERVFIKRYNLFQFFNIQYDPNFFKLYYNSKKNILTNASSVEFQLSNILVRAGFVENGYVANHLIKKKLFSVNGYITNLGYFKVYPWDIIKPAGYVAWWLVFARLSHFTSVIRAAIRGRAGKWYRFKEKSWKGRIFKRRIPPMDLKRRSLLYMVLTNFDFQETVFKRSIRTYVLNPIPRYMEISYKLFLCIIFRNAINSDLSLPYTIKSLKYLLLNKFYLKRFNLLSTK